MVLFLLSIGLLLANSKVHSLFQPKFWTFSTPSPHLTLHHYPRSTLPTSSHPPQPRTSTRLSSSVLPPPPQPLKLPNLRRVFPEPHPQLSVLFSHTPPNYQTTSTSSPPPHLLKLIRLPPPSLVPSLPPSLPPPPFPFSPFSHSSTSLPPSSTSSLSLSVPPSKCRCRSPMQPRPGTSVWRGACSRRRE